MWAREGVTEAKEGPLELRREKSEGNTLEGGERVPPVSCFTLVILRWKVAIYMYPYCYFKQICMSHDQLLLISQLFGIIPLKVFFF